MKHVNEIKFEGDTPWIKAMNKANEYWTKYNNAQTEKEKDEYFFKWTDMRFEIESGVHGNNSPQGGGIVV